MKAVRWLTFSNPERSAGTIVHFLPATPGAATPYPVEMVFTIFGRGIERNKLVIDGARLLHPDGVRLDSLFDLADKDSDHMVAVEIDIYSNQIRSDVSASQCVIEFLTKETPIKFSPRKIILRDESSIPAPKDKAPLTASSQLPGAALGTCLLMKDAVLSPSIVIVNGTGAEIRPEIYAVSDHNGEKVKSLLPLGQVAAQSVVERKVEGTFFANIPPQEMSWGLMRALTISSAYDQEDRLMYYVVYRDSQSAKIISVQAL